LQKLFANIALKNLYQISKSDRQSLHAKAFIRHDEIDFDQLIQFLERHDYIELEKDDDIYFLTPETYESLEKGKLESRVFRDLEIFEVDEKIQPSEEDILLKESILERKSKQHKLKKYGVVLFALVLIFLFSYYNGSIKKKGIEDHLTPAQMEELRKDLQHKVDSILAK